MLKKGEDAAYDHLARRTLHIARRHHLDDTEVDFRFLLERLAEERHLFIQANAGQGFDGSKDAAEQDLKRALQSLTQRQIFFQGIRPHCVHCGSAFWYEPGEVNSQQVECKGCRLRTSVPVESRWFYKLNGLVRNAVALHGGMAVVTTLSEMELHHARSAFVFEPGVALYEKHDSASPAAEIDILGLIDGELLLGEVKTRSDEFEAEDLRRLAELARELTTDVAAIGTLYDDRNLMVGHEATLKSLLVGTDIRTLVVTLGDHCFQPAYHI
jgi:hypothetical protein